MELGTLAVMQSSNARQPVDIWSHFRRSVTQLHSLPVSSSFIALMKKHTRVAKRSRNVKMLVGCHVEMLHVRQVRVGEILKYSDIRPSQRRSFWALKRIALYADTMFTWLQIVSWQDVGLYAVQRRFLHLVQGGISQAQYISSA